MSESRARARHRGRSKDTGWFIGLASLGAGLLLIPPALIELFRYSPYEDPAAGRAGLLLAIGFLLMAGIPVLVFACQVIARIARGYRAWTATLTPEQRAWLHWGEFAALMVAHEVIRHHRRKTNERLTASVLGETPEPLA